MTKSKTIIILTIIFIVYYGLLYVTFSIGGKTLVSKNWSQEGLMGFCVLSFTGILSYIILLACILFNEIKIKNQ